MGVIYAPEKKRQINTDDNDLNLVNYINNVYDDAKGLTDKWRSNQEIWHKLRMMIKKEKTFPFPDCSNIRMPTLEIFIRKLKAQMVNVIYSIRPIVQVIPSIGGNYKIAQKIEKFLDHLIMDVMKLQSKSIILADQTCEKGFELAKPYWRLETTKRVETLKLKDISIQEAFWIYDLNRTEDELIEAIAKKIDADRNDYVWKDNYDTIKASVKDVLSGKEEIEIEVEDVIYNFPDVALISPERFLVPSNSGFDPQELGCGIHEFYKSYDEIKAEAKSKGYDRDNVAKLDKLNSTNTDDLPLDTLKNMREGIERLQGEGELKIWEAYLWYDLNGDGYKEKCVITVAADFGLILRKITLPFYSGKWPIVKFFYELREDRWFHHRGLPEIIEDIVKEIDIQHMQKIDSQTLRNSPVYLYRAGMINPQTTNFSFGQGIPVQGLQPLGDVIAPLERTNPNAEFSYKDEQMILESKVSEIVGQVDYTLQSMINKRQPRTAQEVAAQQQASALVSSLDLNMFKSQHEDLFNFIWELWCQYGDDEYEFAYFGKDGWEPIRMTKEEVQGKYKITIRGNDQNSNPQIRLQKAEMVLQSQSNPVALQMGVVNPMTMAKAYQRYYEELGIQNAEELYTIPQPQPPALPKNLPSLMKHMTTAEKAQALAKVGIDPDIQGRQMDKMHELHEQEVEESNEEDRQLLEFLKTQKGESE